VYSQSLDYDRQLPDVDDDGGSAASGSESPPAARRHVVALSTLPPPPHHADDEDSRTPAATADNQWRMSLYLHILNTAGVEVPKS